MGSKNVLIPKPGTRHVGFSPMGRDVVLTITNKYFGSEMLNKKVDEAASSIGVSSDEILNKLDRHEEVEWPPTSKLPVK